MTEDEIIHSESPWLWRAQSFKMSDAFVVMAWIGLNNVHQWNFSNTYVWNSRISDKWCNWKFLQICSDEKNEPIYILDSNFYFLGELIL